MVLFLLPRKNGLFLFAWKCSIWFLCALVLCACSKDVPPKDKSSHSEVLASELAEKERDLDSEKRLDPSNTDLIRDSENKNSPSNTQMGAGRPVYYPYSSSDKSNRYFTYYENLLRLSLSMSPEDCQHLKPTEQENSYSEERVWLLLANNRNMDVVWASTSKVREKQFKAIEIDILKGLKGYRTILVEEDRLKEFSEITALSQLKARTVGSGSFWMDTAILEANNFNVVKFPSYNTLFPMLERGRFDFASRGLDQTGDERIRLQDKAVRWVPNLMLHYPLPFYFFVRKDDPHLAECIEIGLNNSIRSGQFDELFYSIETFRMGAELLEKENTIFELANPFL